MSGADVAEDCSRDSLSTLLLQLHRHKDRTYGDAWRRRGELLSIFCNIARKHDRLEIVFSNRSAPLGEESAPLGEEDVGDTTGDLAIYVGKYLTWIADRSPGQFEAAAPHASAQRCTLARGPEALDAVFEHVRHRSDTASSPSSPAQAWEHVRGAFGRLEDALMAQAASSDSAQSLPMREKTSLAWSLLDASLALLVALCRQEPETLSEIPRQIAEYKAG